jgi:hypothetical protein
MFTNLSDLTKAMIYYALAFGLGLTVTLVMPPTTLLAVAFMWTPTIAVLLMQFVITRDGYSRASWAKLGLHRLGLRGWGMALLVPLLVVGTLYALARGTGIAAIGARHPISASGILGLALSLLLAADCALRTPSATGNAPQPTRPGVPADSPDSAPARRSSAL